MVALALLGVLAAGCAERVTGPRARLSTAAATEAFTAMTQLPGFSYGFNDDRPLRAATGQPNASLLMPMNTTDNCPVGGWTNLLGELFGNEDTGEVGMNYRQTLSNCQAQAEDGRLWTFHGHQALSTAFVATYNMTTRKSTVDGRIMGLVQILADGYDAECELDVMIEVSEDVGQFRGFLCGRAIVVPYTPPQ
jgi:hypothetical protein